MNNGMCIPVSFCLLAPSFVLLFSMYSINIVIFSSGRGKLLFHCVNLYVHQQHYINKQLHTTTVFKSLHISQAGTRWTLGAENYHFSFSSYFCLAQELQHPVISGTTYQCPDVMIYPFPSLFHVSNCSWWGDTTF